MLEQIKALIAEGSVRAALASAASRADAVKVLVSEGAAKGYRFTVEGVDHVLSELSPTRSRELSEQELLLVSGGRMADSAPKLCHTESCGGGHAGCC